MNKKDGEGRSRAAEASQKFTRCRDKARLATVEAGLLQNHWLVVHGGERISQAAAARTRQSRGLQLLQARTEAMEAGSCSRAR